MTVRADLNVSLDGIASPSDQSPENPMGADWPRLVEEYTATRTFRSRVLGETSGEGTTGMDDDYGRAYFDEVGAEIMGAAMFGLHAHPDDPDWRGWWGENPPFHVPVFVLTHKPRPSLEMAGGTTFHFIEATPEDALARAVEVADGKDVRIGGGVDVVQQFLRAGLIDRLHLAIVPVVFERGRRIWDGLRGIENDYDMSTEVSESGVIHITFTRR